ncbi:hypothetical protein [Salinigranum sp.]|uniref:hypothetical protein n=1 Tax=Salinigranum sp. TaxID=1966351 RepID=UPI003566F61A
MAPRPFDDHLARLSRRDRATFVGALLSARGWDVDVDPPVVRATRGDERQVVAVASERVLSLPGRGLPREPLDAVVGVAPDRTRALASTRDASAWDASTLYEMARYGLDPTATDRLFRDHFGVGSEAVGHPDTPDDAVVDTGGREGAPGPPTADRGRGDVDRPDGDDGTRRGRSYQWVVPALVLLGVVLVGGGLVAQAWADAPSPEADAVPTADSDGPTTLAPASTSTMTTTPAPRTIIPGLTDEGIDDTAVLTREHAAALRNRSFTMRVTYTERVGDETVGTAREVVRVETGTVYRSRGTQSGNLTSDLVPVIVRDLYADGDGRYLRQGDDALRVGDADDPGTGQVVDRSQTLVTWYLSGDRSGLVEQVERPDGTYYRVSVAGTTDRRIDSYRATGLVSDRGLVVRVDATYRLPDSDRVATLSLRHSRVGNTTVDRPAWMPPQNETASDPSTADSREVEAEAGEFSRRSTA